MVIHTYNILLSSSYFYNRSKKIGNRAGTNERELNVRQRRCNKRARAEREGSCQLKLPGRDKPQQESTYERERMSSDTPKEREARLQWMRDTQAAETPEATVSTKD